jgi:8-oxo-dGTP diphosphatase
MDLDSTIFYSHDIEKVIPLYRDVLGFTIDYQREDKFVSFIFPNGARLGIKKSREEREAPGSQTVFIGVGNIEELYEQLKSSIEIYKNLTEESWGKEFSILDADSNKVLFIQRPSQERLQRSYMVAGVILEQDNKYLLVQEKKAKAYGLWNFPAGRVEVGDSFEATAIKEAKEETGYTVELVEKLGIYQHSPKVAPKHTYVARITGGELEIPEAEILDAQWFRWEEIVAMQDKLRSPWIVDALSDYRKLEGK